MASSNDGHESPKPISSGTTSGTTNEVNSRTPSEVASTPFAERGGSQPSLTSDAGKTATPPPKTD